MRILILLTLIYSFKAVAQQANSVNEAYRWQAKIEELATDNSAKGIPFLKMNQENVLIESTSYLHYTNIKGRFSKKVTQATLNSKPMPLKEDGSFDIHFGFTIDKKTFVITAIDDKNKIFRMQYRFVPINQKEAILEKTISRRWRFSGGAGLTRLSFRQRNVDSFDQYAITIKASATYQLIAQKLDLGFSSFFNLVPIGSTSPVGYKIQYLGVNGRVTWNLIGAPSALRINLSGGLYYNTSLSEIGFANIYGPQLYPEFIYIFDNGNSLLLYGKYSPALSQAKITSLSENREVAAGIHYSFPITFTNRMSVGIDLSQMSLSEPAGDWAATNTYSLSGGISF